MTVSRDNPATVAADPEYVNIAQRLTLAARSHPDRRAVSGPVKSWFSKTVYRHVTFAELEAQSNAVAQGLMNHGVAPGTKLVLFVPFSIEFITLTFALFKVGATIVLIDPGMGRANIFNCLADVEPQGFVAIPKVHAIRWLLSKRFPRATLNFSVGAALPGVVATYDSLQRASAAGFQPIQTRRTDAAAIIFTSGSTGPPKGVLYEHGMFDAQVEMIQQFYGIQPGEVDLPGFPLFGLFNAAMGVTTVIPDMDPTKPARVDPEKIIAAVREQQVTQAFGSPAFWNRVGRYCVDRGIAFPNMRRALSAGGPVPTHVLDRMNKVLTHPQADLFTPYGATECLPVASIGGKEVLGRTAARSRQGAGTCVGRPFAGVDVRIVEITDDSIGDITQARELPVGEIGEIIVRSPSATREYYNRPQPTRLAKIPDGEQFWHRMGDVGYLDNSGLLWFCGRKAHIVQTTQGRMFSVCCEAILDEHPAIYRSALVGIGPAGSQTPVIVAEPEEGRYPPTADQTHKLIEEMLELASQNDLTSGIKIFLLYRSLPVDTRHNVKINREALARWAAQMLKLPGFSGTA